jgi:hypothetical protein
MGLLLGGCMVLAGLSVASAALLPRQGRVSRVVGTWLEPYVALALVSGFAFAAAMIIAGVLALFGA